MANENEAAEESEKDGCGIINLKVPKEMAPLIEDIRRVRASAFESTTNTSIAKAAVVALHEKVVKGSF